MSNDMQCLVYKSLKQIDYYLYVNRDEELRRVPDGLKRLLGRLQKVLELELGRSRNAGTICRCRLAPVRIYPWHERRAGSVFIPSLRGAASGPRYLSPGRDGRRRTELTAISRG